MTIIDSLVTDRAKADVDRLEALRNKGFAAMTAAEKSEWLNGMKGAYNYTDLNRVASAMLYLSDRFRQYGYQSSVKSRADWNIRDVPTLADMDTYLDDLRRLRAVFAVLRSTPEVPGDMDGLTWQEANDIEQILTDINTVIESVLKSFRRSGSFMFFSGHQPFPSAESDLGRTVDDIDALGLAVDDLDKNGTDFYILSYGVMA